MITRNYAVTIEPTPEELAFEFTNLSDGEMAVFFNEIARITKGWDAPFCFQLQGLTDNEELDEDGRLVMELIGEYGPKQ